MSKQSPASDEVSPLNRPDDVNRDTLSLSGRAIVWDESPLSPR